MKLDETRILDEAFALLHMQGFPGLSLRKLGQRLQVQPMALYWHFASKGALLDAMASRITDAARREAYTASSWDQWLFRYGLALHDALLAHRDSARLFAERALAIEDPQARTEELLAPLTRHGVPRETAIARHASVVSLAVGWALLEQTRDTHDYLSRIMDIRGNYRSGLEAMITGFSLQEAPAKPLP